MIAECYKAPLIMAAKVVVFWQITKTNDKFVINIQNYSAGQGLHYWSGVMDCVTWMIGW